MNKNSSDKKRIGIVFAGIMSGGFVPKVIACDMSDKRNKAKNIYF